MTYKISLKWNQVAPLTAARLRLGEPGHRAGAGPVVVLAPGLDPEATQYRAIPLPGGNLGLFPGDESLILLSSDTGYRRGANGKVDLVAGQATFLAGGWIPFGDAGGLGGAQEALYRVEGPALFRVVPTRHGGVRHYWVVAAPGETPRVYTGQEALAYAAMGTDPLLSQLVRDLPEFAEALALAETLAQGQEEAQDQEEEEEDEEEGGGVWGVNLPFLDPKEALKRLGLHLPPGAKGVSGVGPGGVLLPGKDPLLLFHMGSNRRRLQEFVLEDAQVLAHLEDPWDRRAGLFAVIPGPRFRVRWVGAKGGERVLTLEGLQEGGALFPWKEVL